MSEEIKKVSKKWYQTRWVWVVIILFFLILSTAGNETKNDTVIETQTTSIKPVFNIPELVGKNLNELIVLLGTPTQDSEPTQLQSDMFTNWEKAWVKDGYFILATYDIKTKKIVDLFLGTDNEASFETFKNTENILNIGNISTSSNSYSVNFVKALNADGYTGAIVKEK